MKSEVSKKALNDLELVNAIKSENERVSKEGFDKLYKKYHDSMLYHFRGMMNDEDEAKALVLEAFMKVSTNINKFDSKEAVFSTWLFKLTQNLFIDKLRKKKEETISLSDIASFDDEGNIVEYPIVCADKSVEDEIIDDERNAKIFKIVDSMENKELSEIVKMRYFDGMSYNEISQLTRNHLGTVKAFLYRAKSILREEFEKANICLEN